MKKILGNSSTIRKDVKYYKQLSEYDGGIDCVHCRRKESDGSLHLPYKVLSTCPNLETCQTYDQWKFQMLISKVNRMFAQKSIKKPKLILYFLPIGPFPEFIHQFTEEKSRLSLFQLMANFLRSFFPSCEMRHLPEIDISEIAPHNRCHTLTGKLQYLVSDVLVFLQKRLPTDGYAIVALSWHDMYPCDNLNFILGQGSSHHSACVSTFGRFDPNPVKGFKGREDGIMPEEMKDIDKIDQNVLWKLMKVLSHETCHVFGLGHCTVFECLMNSSSSTQEALSQPLYLCPLCMSKIQHLQTILKTSASSDETTVKGHLMSLLNFMKGVFDTSSLLSHQNIANTISYLENMVEYLKTDEE